MHFLILRNLHSGSFKKGGIMMTRYQSYYCYLNNGKPTVVESQPANFAQLPFHYTTQCPNSDVARLVYHAELKIMSWRTSHRAC